MGQIRRPALRYYGGKWKLAPWIISHFPEHQCYVEPFGGAGSVLLRKRPSKIEVYNDLNDEIVNYFRVLRERPDELIRAIDLTPYSRSEFLLCQEPCEDELERARRTIIWACQGRGRVGNREPGGWRSSKIISTRPKTPAEDWKNFGHLYEIAERFKFVYIENDDANKILDRYDSSLALFYVDPPYLMQVRGKRIARYRHEYDDDEHIKLADHLHKMEGMVIVSGYRCDFYDELYGGWVRVDKEVNLENSTRRAIESLYINPAAQGAARQMRMDLTPSPFPGREGEFR
jgi:DNA adenine methylase